MFQSLFGSLLNHFYHYANENVSVKHLSFICITSILITIYSLKNCSVYGGSCRIYSPKSFGSFWREFRYVKKKIEKKKNIYIYVIYWQRVGPYGEKLYRGHSFSSYGPTLSRKITYISLLFSKFRFFAKSCVDVIISQSVYNCHE